MTEGGFWADEQSTLGIRPARTRGRLHPEPSDGVRGPRDAFQRDRDRVIHSISFRRLRHKTQVFLAPDGDHFRVRLTHSHRGRADRPRDRPRAGAERGPDRGAVPGARHRPPAVRPCRRGRAEGGDGGAGGFDHNGHTLRTLTAIERPYPRWDGLNLTWETLEGLAKHNGPQRHPGWALAAADAAFPLELDRWPGLEAQVAALADDIAYDNHDIDDGLRAGLLSLDQLLALPFVAAGWDDVRARFPDVAPARLVGELIRSQIGAWSAT